MIYLLLSQTKHAYRILMGTLLALYIITLLGCNAVVASRDTDISVKVRDVTPSVTLHTGVQPYEDEEKTDATSSDAHTQYTE